MKNFKKIKITKNYGKLQNFPENYEKLQKIMEN